MAHVIVVCCLVLHPFIFFLLLGVHGMARGRVKEDGGGAGTRRVKQREKKRSFVVVVAVVQ